MQSLVPCKVLSGARHLWGLLGMLSAADRAACQEGGSSMLCGAC